MLHASTKKLIDRLSEMTELGKLDWTDGDNGNITFATEGYSVSLTEAPNEVVIASLDGVELERATVDELAVTQLEDGTTYTAIVAAMTKEAARIARGTETAISTLLAGMQDAAEEAGAEELSETAEELQEDLGDETAVVSADAIEAIETEAPAEDIETEITEAETPSEIGASWKDSVETEPEVADEFEATDAIDAETAESETIEVEATPEVEVETEVEASEGVESNAAFETTSETDGDSEPTLESEPNSIEDIETASTEDVDTESNAQTEFTADVEQESESQDEQETVAVVADAEETVEASEFVAEEETETVEVEVMEETVPLSAFGATVASEPEAEPTIEAESETELESESDVSEAVARLADEVNSEDDTSGLATAAASAVGAVALAAGLTHGSSEEEAVDDTPEDTIELTEVDAETAVELESAAPEVAESPPAYIPFGLEASNEDTDVDIDEPIETVIDVEAATESEIIVELETPASPTEELAQMVDDALSPHETANAELESEPSLTVEVEPEDGEVVFTSSEPDVDPIEDVAFVPAFESPDATTEVDAEAVEETVLLKSSEDAEPDQNAPQSYSLSGIGAGFGLGALSAKTEATGLPSVSEPNPASGEKVIIDATDDVLPKPEGNLNVALAETASAAVSAANAEPALETVDAGAEDSEPEADILKPRTRFNPWD